MYGLTKQEKLEFIIEKSKELGISSYEFGQNTELSDLGSRNILEGKSKNPRTKNLNLMLNYLESIEIGSNLKDHKNYNPSLHNKKNLPTFTKEPKSLYTKTNSDKLVPYYNVEITSTQISSFNEAADKIEFYIDFQPLNDCTAYVPYYSDSMSPTYKSGNKLALKHITNLDIILYGQPHYIITSPNANSYKTVRCVHYHQDQTKLILRATNPKYAGDIIIEKKDILSLYLVKGRVELNEG